MKHNNDFKYDLEVGKEGEDIIANMLEGDKVEVKSEQTKIDKNWSISGNCYVEYESRDKKSGLSHTKSKYWAVNFMDNKTHCFTIILPTIKMKEIARKYYKQHRVAAGGDENTSKGVLVPIAELINPEHYMNMPSKEEIMWENSMRIAEEIRRNEEKWKKIEEQYYGGEKNGNIKQNT